MKTRVEEKFDQLIKEGFHELLKPLGFKKKGNNFYLKCNGIGQIVNVQKSMSSTKQDIKFTINIGIFIPEHWLVEYNFFNKTIPDYPTEPECSIRRRIGTIKKQEDIWYNLNADINENDLITEMKRNINDFILPYFNALDNKDKIVQRLEGLELGVSPLDKLIIYAELNYIDKAKQEYEKLLSEKKSLGFRNTVKEYGAKYKLD